MFWACPPERGHKEDTGHAGGTTSLSWPGSTLGSYRKSWIRLHRFFVISDLLCLINQTRHCTPKIACLLLFLNVDLQSRGKVSMFSRFLLLTDGVWRYSQWVCSGGEVISTHLLCHLPSSRGGASSLASGFLPDSCHWLFMILLLRLIVHVCLHLIGSCSISIIYVLCSDYYCFVAVICICDIYCTSAVMEKIISPLWFSVRFLLFPIMDFFFFIFSFFLTQFEGQTVKVVSSVQNVNPLCLWMPFLGIGIGCLSQLTPSEFNVL